MLESEPKDVFLNYALAMEYFGQQKWEETKEQLLNTQKLNNDYLPCYYQLGQVCEKLGKETEAIEYYKKGLELAKKQSNNKAVNELNEAIWMLEE